jgi:hypothetical protein
MALLVATRASLFSPSPKHRIEKIDVSFDRVTRWRDMNHILRSGSASQQAHELLIAASFCNSHSQQFGGTTEAHSKQDSDNVDLAVPNRSREAVVRSLSVRSIVIGNVINVPCKDGQKVHLVRSEWWT